MIFCHVPLNKWSYFDNALRYRHADYHGDRLLQNKQIFSAIINVAQKFMGDNFSKSQGSFRTRIDIMG